MKKKSDFFVRNAGALEGILGGVEDLTSTNSYLKALQGLKSYEDEYKQRQQYSQIASKLNNVDISKIPTSIDVPDGEGIIGSDSYKWAELPKTNAYTKFNELYTAKNPDLAPDAKIPFEEFDKFLKEYPEYAQELRDQGFYQPKTKKQPLNQEELLNEYYKAAGLTPEDISFYNEKKKDFYDNNEYNKRLARYVAATMPNVVSRRGKLGTSLYETLGNQASMLQLPTEADRKYTITNLGDGNLLRQDDKGNYQIIPYQTNKKEKPKSLGQMNAQDFNNLKSTPGALDQISQDDFYNNYRILPDWIKSYVDKTYPMIKADYDKQDAEGSLKKGGSLKGGLNLGNLNAEDESLTGLLKQRADLIVKNPDDPTAANIAAIINRKFGYDEAEIDYQTQKYMGVKSKKSLKELNKGVEKELGDFDHVIHTKDNNGVSVYMVVDAITKSNDYNDILEKVKGLSNWLDANRTVLPGATFNKIWEWIKRTINNSGKYKIG